MNSKSEKTKFSFSKNLSGKNKYEVLVEGNFSSNGVYGASSEAKMEVIYRCPKDFNFSRLFNLSANNGPDFYNQVSGFHNLAYSLLEKKVSKSEKPISVDDIDIFFREINKVLKN